MALLVITGIFASRWLMGCNAVPTPIEKPQNAPTAPTPSAKPPTVPTSREKAPPTVPTPIEKPQNTQSTQQTERAQQAASTLKIGKLLAKAGKVKEAQGYYRTVVEKYPETEAATEARTLLGEPPPAPPSAADGLRTWTDVKGKQLEASFVSLIDGRVTLKKKDGSTLAVPLERLSPADQQYAKQAASPVG